jgi:hypothetical protein
MAASPERLRPSRFLLAAIVSAALILWAPFIGRIRSAIKSAFPGQFVRIVGAVVAVLVLGAVVAALVRIRERRAVRYSLIAIALVFGAWYAVSLGTGNPEVDVVERFHFVEYGLVTLLFYRAWRPLDDGSVYVLPVLCGILVGTFEEWFQWFIPVRIGEMRDVFLNGVAIACGLLFSIGADPPAAFRFRLRRGSIARMGMLTGVVAMVFALFLQAVHLGFVVSDPDTGAFRSRYSADELAALSADRAQRWRSDPPLVLRRLSREDQYMSEGVWHVQARNKAWDARDWFTAWQENRILETFYAPVLDTPSYVSKAGHRWAPEQRADAQRRLADAGAAAPASFVSAAQTYPLYAWPRPAFWAAVCAVILLVVVPAVLVDRRWVAAGSEAARL